MCVSPIIMRNRSKDRYGGMEYIKVPCRNCAECARAMQSDYTVRAYALWNSLPPFYYAYFCTLTFRNEDLPKTHVYRLSEDGSYYQTLTKVPIPCFNHQLFKRFRKNFFEFIKDMCGFQPYMLTTCEFGEKKHRPHYHCIIFVPFYQDWKHFKQDLERFWHYGFTMDKRIACVDGVSYQRSFHRAIEYVTKYVCKYNQWLPFYLKSDQFVTDFPPYDIKPRVFTSNHFGSALESILTEQNYELNNVFIGVKDDRQDVGRTFSLPAYYRRRKHITTEILFSYVDKNYWRDHLITHLNTGSPIIPYLPKVLHRPKVFRKVITFRSEKYCNYLYNDFKKSLRNKLFSYDKLCKTNNDFRLAVKDKFGDESIQFTTVYNKICSMYLERHVLPESAKSLSLSLSLPYVNRVEYFSKIHYLVPKRTYGRTVIEHFYYQTNFEHSKGLPFPDYNALPRLEFSTLKTIPFSLYPADYMKLEFMEEYQRKHRIIQIKRKEVADAEWLKIHVKPYLESA